MADVNWVKSRAACSLSAAFKKLQASVERDVAEIRETEINRKAAFDFHSQTDRFLVIRSSGGAAQQVQFKLDNGCIEIEPLGGRVFRPFHFSTHRASAD